MIFFFSASGFSEGQGHLRSAGEVVPSAPILTADPGPPECTGNSRYSVEGEERRRCSSSWSFLNRLDTRECIRVVLVSFTPKSFRIHKPGSITVLSLQVAVCFGLSSGACDRGTESSVKPVHMRAPVSSCI